MSILDNPGLTLAQAASRYAGIGGSAQAEAFVSKLQKGQASAVLTVVGDSTGAGTTRWVRLTAADLAAQYPAYSVVVYEWDNTNTVYQAPVTIQTGTGSYTLTVYNGSASGRNSAYSLTNLSTLVPVAPDIVLVSHGHNEAPSSFKASYRLLLNAIRRTYPRAVLTLVAQNPNDTRYASTPTMADTLAMAQTVVDFAAVEGLGLIDVTAAFLESPAGLNALNNSDGVHPSDAAGMPLWTSEVRRALTRNRAVVPAVPRPVSDFVWVPASQFGAVEGSPNITGPTNGLPETGWALDATVDESVGTMFYLPPSWTAVDMHLHWCILTEPGGNAGAAQFTCFTRSMPTALPGSLGTQTELYAARTSETLASTGESNKVRRITYSAGTLYEYGARGLHGIRLQRRGSAGADTLGIDAVFLGLLFERITG